MAISYIKRKTGKYAKEEIIKNISYLYYNPFGKILLHSIFKRKLLTTIVGKYMNTKLSTKLIPKFNKKKNPKDYECFNDFFIEKKDINIKKSRKEIMISPADCKILAFESINQSQPIFVKGEPFNINTFLKDKELSKEFTDASIAYLRLAPSDYHRYHFPVDGKIKKTKRIENHYYSVLKPVLKKINVFMENTREITQIGENTLMCEIGATFVGSIKQTYKGKVAIKGQEKGYFAFGGSSIILIFKKGTMKFDEDLLINSRKSIETQITVGEKIGKWK